MLVLLSTLVQPAEACGGFFCNNVPVDQGGEDILFGVDDQSGDVTVHVKIDFTGDADEFAWIVPVPQVPEILLSTERLFSELAYRTAPTWDLQINEQFDCTNDYYTYPVADAGYYSGSSSAAFDTGSNRVDVIATSEVGPYETVTLQANDAESLISWLQDNGYQLPDQLDPVLAPYIADQAYFVALKLKKNQSVGSLQPIALKYPGGGASIPIQLTSIAATPDMRLHVYVLGQHRSVPDSYLHVKVNDLVVNWFDRGSNYEDAITVAADEAGGHAFATDYSGPSSVMSQVLWQEGRYDIAALRVAPDAYAFFNELLYQGFPGDSQMLALFQTFLPEPAALVAQGVDEQSFYNCLSCYAEYVDQIPFDAPAFADAVDERIVQPLHDAQTMFDALPRLSRMTSSVSPAEMTVDPTFVFNADMTQDVSNAHLAQLNYLCGWGGDAGNAPRTFVLPDGRSYDLPSVVSLLEQGITEYEYLHDLLGNYAIVIEDTSSSGEPVILVDHTAEEFAKAAQFNELTAGGPSGCGCDQGAGGSALVSLAALGLLARRRRS